jgi:hypothetical protein
MDINIGGSLLQMSVAKAQRGVKEQPGNVPGMGGCPGIDLAMPAMDNLGIDSNKPRA